MLDGSILVSVTAIGDTAAEAGGVLHTTGLTIVTGIIMVMEMITTVAAAIMYI